MLKSWFNSDGVAGSRCRTNIAGDHRVVFGSGNGDGSASCLDTHCFCWCGVLCPLISPCVLDTRLSVLHMLCNEAIYIIVHRGKRCLLSSIACTSAPTGVLVSGGRPA